jgi:hypothetical protein
MRHVLDVMSEVGLKCDRCEPVNLDNDRLPEYREKDSIPPSELFENPAPVSRAKIPVPIFSSEIPPLLHYFLDGSRRTYRIGDIQVQDRRYLPLIAGQVGVAIVERRDQGKGVRPVRDLCRNCLAIALPDSIPTDDAQALATRLAELHLGAFRVLKYDVNKDKDPVDLGVAAIMTEMHTMEVDAVKQMVEKGMLQQQRLLVVDGPLRFKQIGQRQFDVLQFRNVIGLSKSFRPSFQIGGGRGQRDVGYITSALEKGERTPVHKVEDDGRLLGVWYLRLRRKDRMSHPLQGVVKLERFATDANESEDGLDAERVNIISAHVLRERNVTPFQSDTRWASHIYPIYLAESYLKASFMSDIRFRAIF